MHKLTVNNVSYSSAQADKNEMSLRWYSVLQYTYYHGQRGPRRGDP